MAYMLLSMSNFSDKSAEQWSHLSMSCYLIVAGSVPEKGVATSQNSSEFDDWSGVRDRHLDNEAQVTPLTSGYHRRYGVASAGRHIQARNSPHSPGSGSPGYLQNNCSRFLYYKFVTIYHSYSRDLRFRVSNAHSGRNT